jgi:hypothetical protein
VTGVSLGKGAGGQRTAPSFGAYFRLKDQRIAGCPSVEAIYTLNFAALQ